MSATVTVAAERNVVSPGGLLETLAGVVHRRPEALAVACGDSRLTYQDLWRQSGELAQQLRRAGIESGQPVGLVLARSAELLVGVLGILRAGAAYVAVDPDAPQERISYMLRDAGAGAVVASADAILADQWGVPLLTVGFGDPASGSGPTAVEQRPSDAAYMIYTSGSSGLPKGVVVEHAGLVNLVEWHVSAFGLTAADRTTLFSSPGFDASVWEMWPSLCVGASLHVVPDEIRADPGALRDWLVDHEVTVGFVPTPIAENLLSVSWPARAALRFMLTGGSALHVRPKPDIPFTLVNNYGVSEATVVSTSGIVTADDDRAPDIGTPISGVDILVVDDSMQPVERGAVGELVICGVSVARGYVGEVRSAAFVPDPTTPGRRAYRTGDLVWVDCAARVHYVGRRDEQVQVRGVRVEPAEVAAALNRHPAVRASAVLAHADPESGAVDRLTAYVVPAGYDDIDETALREHLEGLVLPAMVPSRFVGIAELPLTLSGKVDAHALRAVTPPAPARPASADEHSSVAPGDVVAQAVSTLLATQLDVPSVGLDDNFFLLGGHSMLGAQLIARIATELGVEMTLRTLFEHPTVAGIAAEVKRLLLEQIESMDDDEVARALAELDVDSRPRP